MRGRFLKLSSDFKVRHLVEIKSENSEEIFQQVVFSCLVNMVLLLTYLMVRVDFEFRKHGDQEFEKSWQRGALLNFGCAKNYQSSLNSCQVPTGSKGLKTT